jgi:hypothetical protein
MTPFDKKLPVRPDEWGFYDPDKAGLAAVLERLAARRQLRRQEAANAIASPGDGRAQYAADGQ